MKLEDLKRLAAARTKGKWKVSGQCFITKKPAPHLYDSINGGTMGDAEFIAACANNIDALIAVVEAAKFTLEDSDANMEAFAGKAELRATLAALEDG